MIFGVCALLHAQIAFSQRNGSDSLWKRTISLRDSAALSPNGLISLLSAEEARIKNYGEGYDSTSAFILRQIGVVHYKLGDYAKAADYFERSAAQLSANLGKPSVNPRHLVANYYWLALLYDSLNNVSARMAALESCISAAMRLHSVDQFSLSALYKRVEYFFDIGDYYKCLEYATMCESAGRSFALIDPANAETGEGFVSSSLTWHINSLLMIKDYQAVEKLLTQKLSDKGARNNVQNQGAILTQLAQLEQSRNNYDRALTYLQKALIVEKRNRNFANCKTILNNIGFDIYFTYKRNPDSALHFYRRALSLSKPGLPDMLESIETLNVFTSMAIAFTQLRRFDSAFVYFQRAFDQLRPGADEATILSIPLDEFKRQKKIVYITALLLEKADALVQKFKQNGTTKDLERAIAAFRSADQLWDRIKREQPDLESKLLWRRDSRRLYEHAIEACYSGGKFADAFFFFEKSRAVLLHDQLNEQHFLGESEMNELKRVKRDILQMETKLQEQPSDEARAMLFRKKQNLDSLVEILKIKNPLYYQSFLDSSAVTVPDVRNGLLKDHDALIEIFEGDSAVYVLTLTSNLNIGHKIDKAEYDSLSINYLHLLSNQSLLNRHFEAFSKVSRRLYRMLFPTPGLRMTRIIVSPSGKYFPFECLLLSDAGQPVKYLVEQCAISYAYSARYLLSNFDSHSAPGTLLGMAPVEYNYGRLPPLRGSDLALQGLKKYFVDATMFTLATASKKNFLDLFAGYGIVQLYTHASANDSTGEPEIFFADSSLMLSELVSSTKPATQLIILSACETGRGKWYQGEGVFSFSRGFAAVGIPSSITNLWVVEDESIYAVTQLFYEHYMNGMPADKALQAAKREFMSKPGEGKLPYFWAASILVGPGNPILVQRRDHRGVIIFSALAIVVLAGLAFRSFRKPKKQATRIQNVYHP